MKIKRLHNLIRGKGARGIDPAHRGDAWFLSSLYARLPIGVSVLGVWPDIKFGAEWRIIVALISLISGGGLYFSLPFEVPAILAAVIFISFFCLWFTARQGGVDRVASYFCGFMLIAVAGFLYALWYTAMLPQPTLSLVPEYQTLSGRILNIKDHQSENVGQKNVQRTSLDIELDSPALLAGQRATVSHRHNLGFSAPVNIGDDVTVGALVQTPEGAIIPNDFNYRRHAFYQGITVSGFSVTMMDVYKNSSFKQRGLLDQFLWHIDQQRDVFTLWLRQNLGAREGGLAAALLVGRRDVLPNDIKEAMRGSGMAHMLAISGLHMALVTGMVFFLLEGMFASIPALALRMTPRKLAAPFALFAAAIYLLYSGQSVSAQRAFMMIAIILLALMLGRKAFSIRSLCLAGGVIFIIQPYAVMTAGFQMSFAATAGLILYFNARKKRRNDNDLDGSDQAGDKDQLGLGMTVLDKTSGLFLSVFAMTCVAQLAVLPVSIYHFHTVSVLAIVSNLVMVPLLSFAVMPALLLLALLFMLGVVPDVYLAFAQYCLGIMAESSLSFAAVPIEPIHKIMTPMIAYGVTALTACFVLLLRPYWLGAVLYSLGLAALILWPAERLADLYIMRSGKALVSIDKKRGHGHEGYTASYAGIRHGSFMDRRFRRYFSVPDQQKVNKIKGNCGVGGCLYQVKGHSLLITDENQVIKQECGQAAVIIHQAITACKDSLMISKVKLSTFGTLALSFSYDGVMINSPTFKTKYLGNHSAPQDKELYLRPWDRINHNRRNIQQGKVSPFIDEPAGVSQHITGTLPE